MTFSSKSLNEIERNYEIYDKRMLTVIRELENERHLLEGTKFKFKVCMDHMNLEYFMKAQKLNRRQVRWTLYLSRFNFILKHFPGIKILIEDQCIYSLSKVVIEELEVEIVVKVL